MNELFDIDSFDEREVRIERYNKKHSVKKKVHDTSDLKAFKKPEKKAKKMKINYKLMDYESEEWYE